MLGFVCRFSLIRFFSTETRTFSRTSSLWHPKKKNCDTEEELRRHHRGQRVLYIIDDLRIAHCAHRFALEEQGVERQLEKCARANPWKHSRPCGVSCSVLKQRTPLSPRRAPPGLASQSTGGSPGEVAVGSYLETPLFLVRFVLCSAHLASIQSMTR